MKINKATFKSMYLIREKEYSNNYERFSAINCTLRSNSKTNSKPTIELVAARFQVALSFLFTDLLHYDYKRIENCHSGSWCNLIDHILSSRTTAKIFPQLWPVTSKRVASASILYMKNVLEKYINLNYERWG